jgi:ABC-type antimicrobial peptide transport system permease subunit
MKDNKWVLASAIVLSISLVFGSIYIGNSLKYNAKEQGQSSDLISKEEVAEYLKISVDEFDKILLKEAVYKANVSVYDSNRFIAFVDFNGKIYYSRNQINKWIEYHLYNNP